MPLRLLRVRKLVARPVVVPVARREVILDLVHHLGDHRRNQKIAAEEEFAILAVEIRGFGIFQEHWPHKGHAGARHLLDACVNVRHHAIAQFDIAFANGFVLGSMRPGFLVRSVLGSVIAVDWVKRAELEPSGQQVGWR